MESRFFAFYQVSAHDIVSRAEAAQSAKAGKAGHGASTGSSIGNSSGGGGNTHGNNDKKYAGASAVGDRGSSGDRVLSEKGDK